MKKLIIFNLHLFIFSIFVGYAVERMEVVEGQPSPYDGVVLTYNQENKFIDTIQDLKFKIERLEKKIEIKDKLLKAKDEENDLWVDQVDRFNVEMQRVQAENDKISGRENIMIANTFVAYSLLTSIIAGIVVYNVESYIKDNR